MPTPIEMMIDKATGYIPPSSGSFQPLVSPARCPHCGGKAELECAAANYGKPRKAWRRKAPDVEGLWWLGWSSTTNYRGLRHEWHTAREYFTRQQIKDCKFPGHGWYTPAVGVHETEPPAMPENDSR